MSWRRIGLGWTHSEETDAGGDVEVDFVNRISKVRETVHLEGQVNLWHDV